MPHPYRRLWNIFGAVEWNTFGAVEGFYSLLIFMHPKMKKSHGTDNITWSRAFVTAFWTGLVGRDNNLNNRAHPAANNMKNKNNAPAATPATDLSSGNSVFKTGNISQLVNGKTLGLLE